jgi:integrase
VEDWLGHLADPDPFALDGPARPARPATIATRRFQIRQLVSALARRGHDISRLRSLRDLVEPETAKEALRFFYERNDKASSSQVSGLAATIYSIAKHWCKLPEAQLGELAGFKRGLHHHVHGLTDKKRERLRQFADRRNVEALLGLPQRIFLQLRRKARPTATEALDLQMVLAIELLLMMPIRRANLVRLRLGPDGHIRQRQDRKGTTHVILAAAEVKNRQPLEFPLPPETAELLELYLRGARPQLADGASEWLFPGRNLGAHKSLDQFSRQFTKTIRRLTGLTVNMHLMRHIAAKLYLDTSPGAYEVVRRVLGHRSLFTTVNSYTGLETEAAVRHYDAVVLGIRDGICRAVDNG